MSFRTMLAGVLVAALLAAAPAAASLGPTTLVSASSGTTGGDDVPWALDGNNETEAITPDGRYVAYLDISSNLASTVDANGLPDVFWHDNQTGQTKLVSVDAAGAAAADGTSRFPSITDDYVAFSSDATNLVAGFADHNAGVPRSAATARWWSSTGRRATSNRRPS